MNDIDWDNDEAVVKARWPSASATCPFTHGVGPHIHIGQPFSSHNYAGLTWKDARNLDSVREFELRLRAQLKLDLDYVLEDVPLTTDL